MNDLQVETVQGWRQTVSLCCLSKISGTWRRIRCLLRKNKTVTGPRGKSGTRSTRRDENYYREGRNDQGCWWICSALLISYHGRKSRWKRQRAGAPQSSSICLSVSFIYMPTSRLIWKKPRESLISCQVKQNSSQSVQQPWWQNPKFSPESWGESSGRQHPRDAAGLFREGRRVSPPGTLPVAAQSYWTHLPIEQTQRSVENLFINDEKK